MINKIRAGLNHAGFKKYFLHTSWQLLAQILQILSAIFVGSWVARYLGPEQYGVYSYALVFVGIFATIAPLGIDNLLVRELVKNKDKRDVLLGTAFYLKLFGAFLVLIIISIAVYFANNEKYTNIIIFIVAGTMIFQSFGVLVSYYQANILGKYICYSSIISISVSCIVKIILIVNNAPIIAFAIQLIIDSIILATAYSIFYYTNKLSISNWKFDITVAKSLLKSSWPLLLSGMVIMVYMKIDQIMIKAMIGDEAVGQYSAAVRLCEAWYFVPVIISSSLFPAIINAKKQSEKLYLNRMQRLYNFLVYTSLAIALAMMLSGSLIVNFLYGKSFDQTEGIFAISIWAGIFVSLGVASSKWYLAENLQVLSFWRTFCGMLINIILNYFFIPRYGMKGAAVATIISQFNTGYLFDLFFYKTRKQFFMKTRALFLNII